MRFLVELCKSLSGLSFDVSRLHDKLDKMSIEDFDKLKEKLGCLLGFVDTPLES